MSPTICRLGTTFFRGSELYNGVNSRYFSPFPPQSPHREVHDGQLDTRAAADLADPSRGAAPPATHAVSRPAYRPGSAPSQNPSNGGCLLSTLKTCGAHVVFRHLQIMISVNH